MKKYLTVLLLGYSSLCIAQIDVKKIVSSRLPVPNGWVDTLISKKSWTLIKEGGWSKGKVTTLKKPVIKNEVKKFTRDSVVAVQSTAVKFFPQHKTFYTGKNYDEYWDMGVSVVSEVLYVDRSFLIIRKVPFFLFDQQTGRVISVEEYRKKKNESNASRNAEFHFSQPDLLSEPKVVRLEVYEAN